MFFETIRSTSFVYIDSTSGTESSTNVREKMNITKPPRGIGDPTIWIVSGIRYHDIGVERMGRTEEATQGTKSLHSYETRESSHGRTSCTFLIGGVVSWL